MRITHSKWRAFELRSNDRSTSHAALWNSRRGLSQRVRYGTDQRPRPFCTRQAHRLVAGRGTGDQAAPDRARYNWSSLSAVSRPRTVRSGALAGLDPSCRLIRAFRRASSGSLAMLAAMRRASSATSVSCRTFSETLGLTLGRGRSSMQPGDRSPKCAVE